jgi:hypothetical protein
MRVLWHDRRRHPRKEGWGFLDEDPVGRAEKEPALLNFVKKLIQASFAFKRRDFAQCLIWEGKRLGRG